MIIDAHCHIDMLSAPEKYLRAMEMSETITIGMTNSPSHYLMGCPHFKGLRHSRLAIGFHPQLVDHIKNELSTFIRCLDSTSYVGEVGLDFSVDHVSNKSLQIACFEKICNNLKGKSKIVSIHSRKAERETIEIINRYEVSIPIFHWYSGPLSLIPQIIELGGYFSFNEAMTLSEKGRRIISKIPLNRLLTESDAPYNRKSNIIQALNNLHIDIEVIQNNFKTLIDTIK